MTAPPPPPAVHSWLAHAIDEAVQGSAAVEALESHARCAICFDLYTHAASLPCQHSFCSLCARRALYFVQRCPVCHATCAASDLRGNFALQAIVQAVRDLREHLPRQVATHTDGVYTQRRDQRRARRRERGRAAGDGDTSDSEEVEPVTSAAPSSTAAAAAAPSVASVFTLDKVDCPICGLKIVASHINRHLDACLGKEENREAANVAAAAAPAGAGVSSNSARMSFPAYNILTDKALRNLLVQAGFPSSAASGPLSLDRESLIRRHREFVFRHNAELDNAAKPASDATLVKDIVRKEKVLASTSTSRSAKQSLLLGAFSANDHTAPTVPTPAVAPLFSARKRSKADDVTISAAATSPSAATERKRPARRSPRKTATLAPPEDLTADDDDSPTTVPTSAIVNAQVDPCPALPAAAAPLAFPAVVASSAASSDPFAQLIVAYEAVHGPRKRWRRKWGQDDSLYTAATMPPPPPSTSASPAALSSRTSNDNGAGTAAPAITKPATAEPIDDSDDITIDHARTTRSASKSKANGVFSLFQAARHEQAESPAPAPPSAPDQPKSASTSSGGNIRVSTAICTGCSAVCRGSFPLGASVTCPRCRPTWMELAAKRGAVPLPPPTSNGKANWQQLAQAQQSQVRPPGGNSVAPSPPVVSAEQRQEIEQRRAAALEKLKAKQQQAEEHTNSAPMDIDASNAPPSGDSANKPPAPELASDASPLSIA